jgi:hypothetical protein
MDVYLLATVGKAEAVRAGAKLAQQMAEAMKAMLPLYTAAVRR